VPHLDVRLPGLEGRSPKRVLLSHTADAPEGWGVLRNIGDIARLAADRLLVEGGMSTAAAFLSHDFVDRLLLYRAPIVIGSGRTLGDIGLGDLGDAHGRWALVDHRRLGSDMLDVYERIRG